MAIHTSQGRATKSRSESAGRTIAPDAGERADRAAAPIARGPRCPSGLIFEIANVLYDASLWWRWFSSLLARLHPGVDVAAAERRWTSHFLPQVRCGRREFGEALQSFLQETELSRGEIDELLSAGLSRRRDLEFEVLPFPGVKSMLTRLRAAGISLAVLTDSAATPGELAARLDRLGLAGVFRVVVSSIELGAVKPAAICYETAIARLALPCEQVWFVGQAAADLAGAASAGLTTIAFQAAPGAVADRMIARIDSLLELVPPARKGNIALERRKHCG